MLIRRIAVALAVMLCATSAFAFDTSQLLPLVTMPLAVAAASDLRGVQQSDLIDLVTQLNAANVPPAEFVQIVRYVPVALIERNGQPQIVDYVHTETQRGITGAELARGIADELRLRYEVPRFELTPVVIEPAPPEIVTTRVNDDLLSLVAMPVAVAAAADLAGIPQQDLMNVVTQLNAARVPPPQFVEVVHYVPVALVNTNTRPRFVDYVTTQVNSGVTGPTLALAVADRLRTYDHAREIDVARPRVKHVETIQIARVQPAHPHGGPPGQLKKVYGYQTGAQVVHGRKPGRVRVLPQPMISSAPQPVPMPMKVPKQHGNPHGGPPGHGHGHGHGHGKGKG